MIRTEDLKNSLLRNALNCGVLDIDFFINLVNTVENKKFKIKGKDWFLFYVDKEGEFIGDCFEYAEGLKAEDEQINLNDLIFAAFNLIIQQINTLYDLDLKDGENYEIFINCLDSHLSLKDDDDFLDLNDEEEQTAEEIKSIIEEFN